jgi:hypothetical protein
MGQDREATWSGLTWVCISFMKTDWCDRGDLYSWLRLIAPVVGFYALGKYREALEPPRREKAGLLHIRARLSHYQLNLADSCRYRGVLVGPLGPFPMVPKSMLVGSLL